MAAKPAIQYKLPVKPATRSEACASSAESVGIQVKKRVAKPRATEMVIVCAAWNLADPGGQFGIGMEEQENNTLRVEASDR